MPFTLPDLPYNKNALEPYIPFEIMRLHHDVHHKKYIDDFNAAESQYASAKSDDDRKDLLPGLNFNGGGYINHALFWRNLAATADESKVKEAFEQAINTSFDDLEGLKKKFNSKARGVRGSGWGWLVYNIQAGVRKLEITTTHDQEILPNHLIPIIGIDMWEHAYYLKYHNIRDDYLDAAWFVIDFERANTRFEEAQTREPTT